MIIPNFGRLFVIRNDIRGSIVTAAPFARTPNGDKNRTNELKEFQLHKKASLV